VAARLAIEYAKAAPPYIMMLETWGREWMTGTDDASSRGGGDGLTRGAEQPDPMGSGA
jgi:hypothetical protein